MKTAMQELIEVLKSKGVEISIYLNANTKTIQQYLEKEKEQIIQAANNGALKSIVHKEKLDEMSENELRDSLVEDTISYGEEYYNQTYNQNK